MLRAPVFFFDVFSFVMIGFMPLTFIYSLLPCAITRADVAICADAVERHFDVDMRGDIDVFMPRHYRRLRQLLLPRHAGCLPRFRFFFFFSCYYY